MTTLNVQFYQPIVSVASGQCEHKRSLSFILFGCSLLGNGKLLRILFFSPIYFQSLEQALKNGADPNVRVPYYRESFITPIFVCSTPNIAELLLAAGAKLEVNFTMYVLKLGIRISLTMVKR